jgi:hypothetical protein
VLALGQCGLEMREKRGNQQKNGRENRVSKNSRRKVSSPEFSNPDAKAGVLAAGM